MEDQLESSGRTVLSREIITRTKADRLIDTVVLILTGFGVIILLLSGFLVVNAMSALITQQIPQIGVMKLIGARRRQIIALYLATVLVYGLLAVAVALPLAGLTSRFLMRDLVAPLLNVMSESYAVPLPLTVTQVAVGLLLPVLAGLAPVLRGTRITTQQALSDVGVRQRQLWPRPDRAPARQAPEGPRDQASRPAGDPQHAAPQRPAGPDPGRADLRHGALCFRHQRAGVGGCDHRFFHALSPV